ncbi:MAG TPA: cobaltochelatase subunit CobN, partial [Allocoleopsis sp.]
MHRLNTIPGGWNPDNEGVIFINQNPAPIIFLTAADTDIQTISNTLSLLPDDFPAIRVTNLLNLQQQLTIDTYAEEVLGNAKIIIIRLLGGVSYWSYGLEVVKETILNANHPISLFILPGDDRPDPTLITHSNCPLSIVNQLWRYFTEGGTENYLNAFKFIVNYSLNKNYSFNPPHIVPKVGIYGNYPLINNCLGQVGILFYRAHYLSGNTSIIDAICQVLIDRNLQPIPVFVSSLRDEEIQIEILSYFKNIDLILNTTSFAISDPNKSNQKPPLGLNVPVFQLILSSGTLNQWKESLKGLSPRDIAMNIALPEIDGRIITRAVSFKSVEKKNQLLET